MPDGTVIAQNMQRQRHQEFIRFLNLIEAEVPQDKAIHVILDNYAAHKKDKVRTWPARHPRWTFHFTPTSCSWLNAVEDFFAKLTRRRLKTASSIPSSISKPPTHGHSSGKPTPITSSPHETEGSKRWNQSTRMAYKVPLMTQSGNSVPKRLVLRNYGTQTVSAPFSIGL